MSATAYISMGSNVGDRESNLRQALERLCRLGEIKAVSSIYETEPVEFTDQPWFLNCAVALDTDLSPARLLAELLAIERDMGRERVIPKGPRLIDLDIVLFGDEVVDEPTVKVPHPAMHERRFVLEPLAEIAPQVRHPVLKRTVAELLSDLNDDVVVKKAERTR